MTWTVAEGRRGRRWREVVADGDAVRHVAAARDRSGRPVQPPRAVARRPALLTLHPEGDGTLHGNRVDRDGVEHVIGVAFDPDGPVLIDDSVIAAAVAAWQETSTDRGAAMRMVVIDGAARVSIVDGATATPLVVAIDADGAPQLHDARVEPLELPEMDER